MTLFLWKWLLTGWQRWSGSWERRTSTTFVSNNKDRLSISFLHVMIYQSWMFNKTYCQRRVKFQTAGCFVAHCIGDKLSMMRLISNSIVTFFALFIEHHISPIIVKKKYSTSSTPEDKLWNILQWRYQGSSGPFGLQEGISLRVHSLKYSHKIPWCMVERIDEKSLHLPDTFVPGLWLCPEYGLEDKDCWSGKGHVQYLAVNISRRTVHLLAKIVARCNIAAMKIFWLPVMGWSLL